MKWGVAIKPFSPKKYSWDCREYLVSFLHLSWVTRLTRLSIHIVICSLKKKSRTIYTTISKQDIFTFGLVRYPAPDPADPHLHHSGGYPGGPPCHLCHHPHCRQVKRWSLPILMQTLSLNWAVFRYLTFDTVA